MTSSNARVAHTIRYLVFCITYGVLFSCTTTASKPTTPIVVVENTNDLFTRTKNANPPFDFIRGTAKVSVTSSDQEYEITEVILAKRGGSLRLESIGPLGESVLFLTTDKKRVYIYSPFENRYYFGLASKKNLSLLIPLPFKSVDSIDLLAGRIDYSFYYPADMSLDAPGGTYALTLMPNNRDRGMAVLTVDARTFYIRAMKLYDPDNNLLIAGEFSSFTDIGTRAIPLKIIYRIPEQPAFITTEIQYKEVKINTYIEDERFALDPPRGVQEIDLDRSIINFNRTPIP